MDSKKRNFTEIKADKLDDEGVETTTSKEQVSVYPLLSLNTFAIFLRFIFILTIF